jgi:6-phosphogluconolactonase
MTIERFVDQAAMADAASQAIVHALSQAIAERGRALFVATGGRTPGPVYDRLAAAPVDWSKVVVTLTDERWVGSGDPESNEGLVRDRLLQGPAAKARFVPLKGDAPTPQAAALEASNRLAELGAPDAVLLGMGEDGHFASLFPHNPALTEGLAPFAPPCIAAPKGERSPPPQARLSLSARWLAAARCTILLITGAEKLRVIEQAQAGTDAQEFPVRAILQQAPHVRILWSD